MALVTIDGKTFAVPDGENVIQAAQRIGVDIPHYCYHPGLPIDGNCRMCLVEIDGTRGPQIACNTILNCKKNKDGVEEPAAVVHTATPLVKEMRRGVMEFLLLNHPIDCPVCDQAGECGLQDYYMAHGKYEHRSLVPKVEKAKAVPIGPLVILDQERCILCSRCVRFTEHVTKTHELVVAGRGDHCRIETFPGIELDNDYSGNVVDICPVGALTSRDFRFKKRVWFLSAVPSICTGCARGCNIQVEHEKAVVYRYLPRFNAEVNDWWLCDRGRMSYKFINNGRLAISAVAGKDTSWSVAFEAFSAVSGARGLGVGESTPRQPIMGFVIGPDASLEDMYVARELAKALGAPLWGLSWKESGKQDDLLMRADLSPNRKGFGLLGISTDEAAFRAALPGLKTLVAIDVDLPPDITARIVTLSTHMSDQSNGAAVALPIAMHAEKNASYAQFEGRIQKVMAGFEPPGDALPAAEILALLGRSLGFALPQDVESVWARLGPELFLPGMTFYKLPAGGVMAGIREGAGGAGGSRSEREVRTADKSDKSFETRLGKSAPREDNT